MSNVFWFGLLFISGHCLGTLIFYFTHQLIFHGRLGNLPILKRIKKIHSMHHARPGDLEKAFFPWWAKILITIVMIAVGVISLPLAIGICSFFPVYAYRHWKAHNGAEAYWAQHHMHHHLRDIKTNFGGIYPIVDIIFGTNASAENHIK